MNLDLADAARPAGALLQRGCVYAGCQLHRLHFGHRCPFAGRTLSFDFQAGAFVASENTAISIPRKRVTDATTLTGGTVHDFDLNQQARTSAGIIVQQTPDVTANMDFRYLNAASS